MTSPFVCVFDYGIGDALAVSRVLEQVGARVEVSRDRSIAENAEGLVVPGAGAFASVMANMRVARGDQIVGRRLSGGRPVFGIGVGMQVMFERGIEHGQEADGLDQWPGTVELLQVPVLPNTGWAPVEVPIGSALFKSVEGEHFHFCHSYGAREFALGTTEDTGRFAAPLVTWATAGDGEATDRFVAAVENGPLVATQFHPEKSGEAGLQLLRNWVATL